MSSEHEMTLKGLIYVQISYLNFSKEIVVFIDVIFFLIKKGRLFWPH